MVAHRRTPWRQLASLALAACLATLILAPVGHAVAVWDGCTLADELRATTCPLRHGERVEGTLAAGSATYRVDAVAGDATLELVLSGHGSATQVEVLDWHGEVLLAAGRAEDVPDVKLSVRLPQPGVYAVRVRGAPTADGPTYALTSHLTYPGAALQPIWPRGLVTGDGPLTGEQLIIRVPRGGTPTGGVGASRILTAPPVGIFSDFTLVSDVQFAQIAGPAALTIRFRYEPEAGGGTGYLLSLDPFKGTVALDSFDEGQRRSIVGHRPVPLAVTADRLNRFVLAAHGSTIVARLDGVTILEADDSRYSKGLLAVGAVTWSEPVTLTFDHLQVSAQFP